MENTPWLRGDPWKRNKTAVKKKPGREGPGGQSLEGIQLKSKN